jgi:hypothetical protein
MDGELEVPGKGGKPGGREPDSRETSPPDENELLPVPAGRVRRETSHANVWKRLSIRRSVRRAHALWESNSNEPILIQLDRIEEQIKAVEGAVTARFRLQTVERRLSVLSENIADRFERLDHRFLQFWEIEERLGHLQEIQQKLDEIAETQAQLKSWADWLRRGIVATSLCLSLIVVFTVCTLIQ